MSRNPHAIKLHSPKSTEWALRISARRIDLLRDEMFTCRQLGKIEHQLMKMEQQQAQAILYHLCAGRACSQRAQKQLMHYLGKNNGLYVKINGCDSSQEEKAALREYWRKQVPKHEGPLWLVIPEAMLP